MAGSCTNSTAFAFADSCWNSIYGPIDLHAMLIVGGFILFILFKPGKKEKTLRRAMSWPLFIMTTFPFAMVIFMIIVDGLEKSWIFAMWHVIALTGMGIIINNYNRSRYRIDTILPQAIKVRTKH